MHLHESWFGRWTASGCRLFLGLIFLTGGLSKLTAFIGVMGPVWLEEALAPHDLGMFARFIGWSEAVIGLLLLSGRFSTLGAIALVPLVVNILMVTISMNWTGTPYVVGGFLVMNVYLLLYDYPRIRLLFLDDPRLLTATRFRRRNGRADVLCLGGIGLVIIGPILKTLITGPTSAPLGVLLCYAAIGVGLIIMVAALMAEDTPDAEQSNG